MSELINTQIMQRYTDKHYYNEVSHLVRSLAISVTEWQRAVNFKVSQQSIGHCIPKVQPTGQNHPCLPHPTRQFALDSL